MKRSESKRRLWEERTRERAASGASRSAYCRSHGYSVAVMKYWERQLKVEAATNSAERRTRTTKSRFEAKGGFARVELRAEPRLNRSVVRLGGGIAIEIEGWPDAQWLGELSRAMTASMSRSEDQL